MGVVISVTNQKGGVGKTVTVSTMAAILTNMDYKVLIIDLDPQRNLDMTAGPGALIDIGDTRTPSILHVMRGECSIEEAVFPCEIGDLVRSSSLLSQWTGRIIATPEEFKRLSKDEMYDLMKARVDDGWGQFDSGVLAERLKRIKGNYDFVLMDTNPSLMPLTVNSLCASDFVLVPAFAEKASLEAVKELWDTIQNLNFYNSWHKIRLAGILITRFKPNTVISKTYRRHLERQAEKMDTIVFQTAIRDNISVLEYMAKRQNLLKYQPRGRAAQDYTEFVNEFIERINLLKRKERSVEYGKEIL